MSFWIQASAPAITHRFEATDASLDEAIETAFPLRTERALMGWHNIVITLSYKYDVSVIVGDVIEMLKQLLSKESGQHLVEWPSSSFASRWSLAWDGDSLVIEAVWRDVSGGHIEALQRTGNLNTTKMAFLAEWKMLLLKVVASLQACGYRRGGLDGLEELADICDRLPAMGILYQSESGSEQGAESGTKAI